MYMCERNLGDKKLIVYSIVEKFSMAPNPVRECLLRWLLTGRSNRVAAKVMNKPHSVRSDGVLERLYVSITPLVADALCIELPLVRERAFNIFNATYGAALG